MTACRASDRSELRQERNACDRILVFMKNVPRVLTIRYASDQPYERRRQLEEHVRLDLQDVLGDVLVRFEERHPAEAHAHPTVRLTGPWTVPSWSALGRVAATATRLGRPAVTTSLVPS